MPRPLTADQQIADLQSRLIEELELVLADTADQATDEEQQLGPSVLYEIQPPSTIISAAARAAAHVFVSFERGYRMSDADEEPLAIDGWMKTTDERIAALEKSARENEQDLIAGLQKLNDQYQTIVAKLEERRP